MDAKHTPGPWRSVVRANQHGPQMVAVDMPPHGAWKPTRSLLTSEDVANASLIAAAPDMLVALHLVGMSAGWQYLTMETRAVIESAIAKAEGR